MSIRFIAFCAFVVLGFTQPALAIDECGSGKRVTCVVDGDTIWLEGEKIRIQDYDTPETTTNICGGSQETALGRKATKRLIELLDQGATVQRTGRDKYGRTLAIIRVNGRSVGEVLIEEGLARHWPDGVEFWCTN